MTTEGTERAAKVTSDAQEEVDKHPQKNLKGVLEEFFVSRKPEEGQRKIACAWELLTWEFSSDESREFMNDETPFEKLCQLAKGLPPREEVEDMPRIKTSAAEYLNARVKPEKSGSCRRLFLLIYYHPEIASSHSGYTIISRFYLTPSDIDPVFRDCLALELFSHSYSSTELQQQIAREHFGKSSRAPSWNAYQQPFALVVLKDPGADQEQRRLAWGAILGGGCPRNQLPPAKDDGLVDAWEAD